MSNIVVNYTEVINLLRNEMEIVRRSDARYSDFKIVLEDERLLAKEKDRSPDTIYIQVKFGAASTNFGVAVLPFSLEVIGINQDTELTQELLTDFVNKYNNTPYNDYTQFFLTPVVSQNNIPIYEGYRSMFIVSATFIIDNQLIKVDAIQFKTGDNTFEDIGFISYTDSTEAQLDPQPYSNMYGRTKSYGSFQTFAFSIVTYPDSSKTLIQKLLKWKYDRTVSHTNETFVFKFKVRNMDLDYENSDENNHEPVDTTSEIVFQCKGVETNQKLGEQPVISATFAE